MKGERGPGKVPALTFGIHWAKEERCQFSKRAHCRFTRALHLSLSTTHRLVPEGIYFWFHFNCGVHVLHARCPGAGVSIAVISALVTKHCRMRDSEGWIDSPPPQLPTGESTPQPHPSSPWPDEEFFFYELTVLCCFPYMAFMLGEGVRSAVAMLAYVRPIASCECKIIKQIDACDASFYVVC